MRLLRLLLVAPIFLFFTAAPVGAASKPPPGVRQVCGVFMLWVAGGQVLQVVPLRQVPCPGPGGPARSRKPAA